jgi:hypothetical protein
MCALCGHVTQLQMSHLIPNFVTAWMKELSLTGNLVQASDPNMSKQQGKREHLLCKICEQRFGVWENLMAKRIFKPFQAGKREPFAYGDWLYGTQFHSLGELHSMSAVDYFV